MIHDVKSYGAEAVFVGAFTQCEEAQNVLPVTVTNISDSWLKGMLEEIKEICWEMQNTE